MKLHGLLYVLSAVAFVVTGQILLKRGMTGVGVIDRVRLLRPMQVLLDIASRRTIWVGLALYICSAALWILALATVPLSVAYPFLGLSYVAIAAVSVLALGEWLTPAQWIGIALVVTGVVTVALS